MENTEFDENNTEFVKKNVILYITFIISYIVHKLCQFRDYK